MGTESGFHAQDLDQLERQFLDMVRTHYPKEAKRFLRNQGNQAKKRLRDKTKGLTKKKTGNLLKGIDKTAPKVYDGDFQIRVYNKAPHAHLIEHGHVMADKDGKPILNSMGQEMWVPGRHPAAMTTRELKASFPGEVEKFVDDLLEGVFDD